MFSHRSLPRDVFGPILAPVSPGDGDVSHDGHLWSKEEEEEEGDMDPPLPPLASGRLSLSSDDDGDTCL